MNTIDKIMGMKDEDFVSRKEVAEICANCAEKMERKGMVAVRAGIIKAALADSEVRSAVKSLRTDDEE